MACKMCYYLLILILSWFTSSVYSDTVYISATSNSSCSYCVTISQFAARFSHHHESNTTAILLPGNHVLKENLIIRNVSFFSILVLESTRTEEVSLSCAEDASIKFQTALSIKVSNIAFIGCVANEIENVDQFRLDDSIYIFLNDTPGLAFIITNTSINIQRTLFLSPTGSVENSSRYAKIFPVEFYGVIISFNSTIVIFDSTFKGSKAKLGAIYAERNDLVIMRCNFSDYKRVCKYQCFGGAVFSVDSRVAISESNFIGNEIRHTLSNGCRGSNITRGGALGFIDSKALIDQTNFIDNSACTGGALYTLKGMVSVLNVNFMQNRAFSTGAGVSAIASYMYINNSNFMFNVATREGALSTIISDVIINNSTFYSNVAGVHGGAIKTNRTCIIISQSMILNNEVNYVGGGIYATHNSTVIIERSILKHNCARKAGGGIKAHHDSKLLFLDKVIIKNNIAYYGGAVHMHFTLLVSSGTLIIANNSAALGIFAFLYSLGFLKKNITLEHNTGSLFVFNSYLKGDGDIHVAHNKQSQNSTASPEVQEGGGLTCILGRIDLSGRVLIEHNRASNGGAILAVTSRVTLEGKVTLSGNSATATGGAVYVYHGEVVITGRTLIMNNMAKYRGGGVHSISSSLILVHDDIKGALPAYLYLISNVAKWGGGVCLEVSAKIFLITRNRLMHFISNRAEYGGAIYVADDTNHGTCVSGLDSVTAASESECFFQSITPRSRLMTINKTISFFNNTAEFSGSVLYGGLLDRCTVNALTNKHIRYSSLPGFMDDIQKFTNSEAVRVCFCKDNKADCSYQPEPVRVMKGRRFSVELVAVDQANNSLRGNISSYLQNHNSSFDDGQWYQSVNSVCTSLTFVVYSLADNETLHIYPEGPCKSVGISKCQVEIEFIPCSCPIGFEVSKRNKHNCMCDCNTDLIQVVSKCNAATSLLTRKGNSWFSAIKYQNKTHFLTHKYCPFDHCVSVLPEISVNLSIPNGADALCASNRSGLLCGKCKPGHSLSLGSSHCLKCPSYWPALLIAIIIVALLSGLALMVIILYLNLTVAVGSLNALIFYANIMLANMSVLMPAHGPTFYTVFIAWMNLDLGLDICFIHEMDMYAKTWIQLAFPIYVISLLFIVIIACEISTKFANLIGRKNPVATLATLILLSYTKLLQSIIAVLSFAHLRYPDHIEVVWLADANIRYLHGKHIPLFITAVVIILLGMSYTLLLLSWQWLVKFSNWKLLMWVKNTKLTSFMDAYNAPYHPRFRYWTGLLLLVRVTLYLVSALNPSKEPKVNFAAIMVVICSLLALSTFQVYKKCILNILEVATYYNIIIVSIIQLVAYKNNSAVSYISASVSFTILLCIITYHIFTIIPVREWLIKYLSRYLLQGEDSNILTRSQHVVTHTEVTFRHATEQI